MVVFWRSPLAASAACLSVAALSVWARSTDVPHAHYKLPFLLCEYAMGVLAYFAAGPRGLNWIGRSASTGRHTLGAR